MFALTLRTRKLSEYTMAAKRMTSEYDAWLAFSLTAPLRTLCVCPSDSKSGNWYDNELQTTRTSSYPAYEAHMLRSIWSRGNCAELPGYIKARSIVT